MEIKEERRQARGWSARRREDGKSPGLARAGGFGSAEALRGAPSGGRAERVSGCRGRAASPQPAAGGGEAKLGGSRLASVRGGSYTEGSPRGVRGDCGGPLFLPVLKVLFPCLPSPWRAPFGSCRRPPLPAPVAPSQFFVRIRGRGEPHRPPPNLQVVRSQDGVGCVLPCLLLHLNVFNILTRIVCGISILGTGKVLSSFLSKKAFFCRRWCEGL